MWCVSIVNLFTKRFTIDKLNRAELGLKPISKNDINKYTLEEIIVK